MNDMKVDDGAGRERRVRVDYPSNSKRAKTAPPEKEQVKPVVTGEVIRRKQRLSEKVFGNFISEDSGTVFGYVITEVLVPAAKTMISDAISQGVERLLFGESRPRPGSRPAYTNYSRPFTQSRYIPGSDAVRSPLSRQQRAVHDFSDIIIGSRGEAEDVLDSLRDLISAYEVATVSDLYDLVGLPSEFTDNKWGWYDLRSASIRAVRGGYLLHLPRTQAIA